MIGFVYINRTSPPLTCSARKGARDRRENERGRKRERVPLAPGARDRRENERGRKRERVHLVYGS